MRGVSSGRRRERGGQQAVDELIDFPFEPAEPCVHEREPCVHLLGKLRKREFRVLALFDERQGHLVEAPIDFLEAAIDLLEALVDLLEAAIDFLEAPVDLLEAPIDLLEALVDLLEALVDHVEATVDRS
ncbi:MAG: hypothetical protein KJ066_21025 [Acidobacteria bacterium]|nr:hypothetical protein [Acidobacteriota bacterium]